MSCSLYAVSSADPLGDEDEPVEKKTSATNTLMQSGDMPGVSGDENNGDYEYRIGVRDLLEIAVFQVTDLDHAARVNTQGYISLPLIGSLKVMGLTAEEAERLIEAKLGKDYLQDPHVTVFVKEYESQKITIEGWVKDPGVYPLSGKTTLLQAIALADGLDRLANQEEIVVFRRVGEGKVAGYKVDITQIRSGEKHDPLVQKNDVIVVQKHGGKGMLDDITRSMRGFLGFTPF